MSRIRVNRAIATLLVAATSTLLIAPAVSTADASKAPKAILHAIL